MNKQVEEINRKRREERRKADEKYLGYTPSALPLDLPVDSESGTFWPSEAPEGALAQKAMFPPGTIETFTGDVYNFQNPDPESIHLEDIAHALSNHCRYAGHTKRFYSVGEHSLLVSRILKHNGYGEMMQLMGLLHDGHEAYVMDAPRPLKPLLGDAFVEVADKADSAIAAWLRNQNILPVIPLMFSLPGIKIADNMALVAERKQLMTAGPDQWEPGYENVADLPEDLVYQFGLAPKFVESAFLSRAHELGVH